MKYLVLFLFTALIFIGCRKEDSINITVSDFQNKSFNFIFTVDKDSLIIDFKDSTYSAFQYDDYDKPWNLITFYNSTILDLDGRTIVVHKSDDSIIEAFFTGEKEGDLILKERNPKWNENLLFGIWIEKRYFSMAPNEFPPPPPPLNNSILKGEFSWPPYYEISKDSIFSNFYYLNSKSELKYNLTIEFLKFNLNSKYDREEIQWKIKTLDDSIMVIDKTVKSPHDNSFRIETKRDTLIKKR